MGVKGGQPNRGLCALSRGQPEAPWEGRMGRIDEVLMSVTMELQ